MATGTTKKSKRKHNNLFGSRVHRRPAPVAGSPTINRFSPSLALACDAVGVPYGAVGVDRQPPHVRSFEMRLDRRDGSCFLPHDARPADRQADRNHPDRSRS